jgi:hypothetical protein
MAIRYDEPGVLFDDVRYTFNGAAVLGDALVTDPCYVAQRASVRAYQLERMPRDHRVSRPRRIYRAVLLCGARRIG